MTCTRLNNLLSTAASFGDVAGPQPVKVRNSAANPNAGRARRRRTVDSLAAVGQASRLPLGRLAAGSIAGETPAQAAGTAAPLPAGPGSWPQCPEKTEWRPSMNRVMVGQASCLSCSAGFQPAFQTPGAGFQPALTGRMPVLIHRQDACATIRAEPRFGMVLCVRRAGLAPRRVNTQSGAIASIRRTRHSALTCGLWP